MLGTKDDVYNHISSPQAWSKPQHRGLSQDRLLEIQLWSTDLELDIMVLTETRWSFEAEWQANGWYHIHTGTSHDRADGVLFLVRGTLCSPDQIGFAAVQPGRIGHLRIHFQHRSLDILGCYQVVDDHSSQKRSLRHDFWTCLEQHTELIPNRNDSVLLVGDFNCSLEQHSPYVGTLQYTWQGCKRVGSTHLPLISPDDGLPEEIPAHCSQLLECTGPTNICK